MKSWSPASRMLEQDDAPSELINRELAHKATLLRDSPYFVHPSEGVELIEKQSILLVLAGLKPVAEVLSGHWVRTSTGRTTMADDPQEVGVFLKSLGLTYHLSVDEHVTKALVALRPELVDEYLRSSGSAAVGKLFGYPESAVTAYAAGTCMPGDQQEKIEQNEGLDEFIVQFRFSQDNWHDELKVARHWQNVLDTYGLR